MARETPVVQGSTLTVQVGETALDYAVDTPAWFDWLTKATGFTFRGPEGAFSARKERAGHGRGGWYWKAYRRRDGRLRRVYLGQSEHLTLDRLRAAACALAAPDSEPSTERPPALTGQGVNRRSSLSPAGGQEADGPPSLLPLPNVAADRRGHARRAASLPAPDTPFVGRIEQLAALRAHLLNDDVRLLVLTGAGGVGKTRLALRAAAQLGDHFAQGVAFVALASLSDPALVASAIAQALAIPESPGRSRLAVLAEALSHQHLLLVLDNFEHVAAAAPIVAQLLAACPRLKVLATSRTVLRLSAEHTLPVPPLQVPDETATLSAVEALESEAVRLFMARAQVARPDFVLTDQQAPVVAEVCRRVDGLPLAIELAAARLRSLPLAALLARLERRLPLLTGGPRDVPARQQTLRDTIAWSYDLLDADEQLLFRRLAIFRGADLEAIEAVCFTPIDRPGSTAVALSTLAMDTLDGVTSLIEKSMLRREELSDGHARYVMFETVREFALERLGASGEEPAVRRRHILHYLALAEEAEAKQIIGFQQATWLARLEREHDNVRTALTACIEAKYAEPAFRLAEALWWFWSAHGHVGEGRERLAELLARFPLQNAPAKHVARFAQGLRAAGLLASAQGDHVTARRLLEEGLRLRRQVGEPAGIYHALEGLGQVACTQGDHAAAGTFFDEALAIARREGNSEKIAWCSYHLATILHARGDHAAASRWLEESVALHRHAGLEHRPGIVGGAALHSLAVVAHDRGEHDLALRLAEEALVIFRHRGYRFNEADCLATLGSIAAAHGDEANARRFLGQSLTAHHDLGNTIGMAYVLERLVGLPSAPRCPVQTLQMAAAAAALRQQAGIPLAPDAQGHLDRVLEPVWQALDRPAGEAAWAAGSILRQHEIVAEAVSSGAAVAPLGDQPVTVLTQREWEVAAAVARGRTNRQIANELFITEGTVANHVAHILAKLDYQTRAQIAVWVTDHGAQSPGTRSA